MHLRQLNEMPGTTDFNFVEANNIIKDILKKDSVDGFFLVDEALQLFECYGSKSPSSGEHWYVIFNDEKTDIDFLMKFKQDAILVDEKKYLVFVPFHTHKKNDSEKLKSITKRVYSYINEKFDRAILSDSKQSKKMSNLWLSWFENKTQYGVKDFKFIDVKNEKSILPQDLENLPHGFINSFEDGENYRMMVDFHAVIKEAEPIVLDRRSLGIFYGKEGRDWIVKE